MAELRNYRARKLQRTEEQKARWYAQIYAYRARKQKEDPEAWKAAARESSRRKGYRKSAALALARIEKAIS